MSETYANPWRPNDEARAVPAVACRGHVLLGHRRSLAPACRGLPLAGRRRLRHGPDLAAAGAAPGQSPRLAAGPSAGIRRPGGLRRPDALLDRRPVARLGLRLAPRPYAARPGPDARRPRAFRPASSPAPGCDLAAWARRTGPRRAGPAGTYRRAPAGGRDHRCRQDPAVRPAGHPSGAAGRVRGHRRPQGRPGPAPHRRARLRPGGDPGALRLLPSGLSGRVGAHRPARELQPRDRAGQPHCRPDPQRNRQRPLQGVRPDGALQRRAGPARGGRAPEPREPAPLPRRRGRGPGRARPAAVLHATVGPAGRTPRTACWRVPAPARRGSRPWCASTGNA